MKYLWPIGIKMGSVKTAPLVFNILNAMIENSNDLNPLSKHKFRNVSFMQIAKSRVS